MSGCLYRRTVTICVSCNKRLDTASSKQECTEKGHSLNERTSPIWWVKYQVGGRPKCLSTRTMYKATAEAFLTNVVTMAQEADARDHSSKPVASLFGEDAFRSAYDYVITRQNGQRKVGGMTLSENVFKELLERKGWKVFHKGQPDFLAYDPVSRTTQYFEVKSDVSPRLTQSQIDYHQALKSAGVQVTTVHIPVSGQR